MINNPSVLESARDQATAVRALYEVLEDRINGKQWSIHEIMIGFSNDVGLIGRLLLAHDGTWPIDGDVTADLKHKLAESIWWSIVIANKLNIDISSAYNDTMHSIHTELSTSIDRMDVESRTSDDIGL